MSNSLNLQPHLQGSAISLRPLKVEDFDELYAIASDPLIWEQHPVPNRYEREVYSKLFQEFIESKGTLVIVDNETKKIIGSSRYYDYKPEDSSVAIGFTMLNRKYWGGTYNRVLKSLMIDHAFGSVNQIIFHVGSNNQRSRKALEKIGAIQFESSTRVLPDGREISQVHYRILKDALNVRSKTELDHLPILDIARKLPQWFTIDGLVQLEKDLNLQYGLVAVNSGRAIGFITYFSNQGEATIGWMGVLPEFRRKSIGKSLLLELKKKLLSMKISTLYVSTLGDSVDYEPYVQTRAFYRKNGFSNFKTISHKENPAYEEELILKNNLEGND